MPEEATSEEIIECPVTRWYLRRLLLVTALFAGLALYFFYDGAFGYPRANLHADLFEAFEAGKNGDTFESFFTLKPEYGKEERERDLSALRSAFETGAAGGSWASYSAKRHLGEAKPERHSEASIRQQFVFGWSLGGLTLATLAFALFQRNRCLRSGSGWLEIPSGRRIDFSVISGADFSKWDHGVAVLETRDHDGRNGRIRIDDYKFSGAAGILERIRRERPELDSAAWPELTGQTSKESGRIDSKKRGGI